MRFIEVVGATTNVDLQGERLTVKDLHDLADVGNARMIPIFNQHDISKPPVGRTVKSEVREMESGEWGLYGIWQVWEPGDAHPGPDPDGRKIAIRSFEPGKTVVSIDASLEIPEVLDELAEIERVGIDIDRDRRKMFDPMSILMVSAGIVGAGFLKAIGQDLWAVLKKSVKSIRAKNPSLAKRVVYSVTVHGSSELEANVILDDATPEMVDALFDRGFAQIDKVLDAIAANPKIVRAVFRGDNDQFTLEYTVDEDGFPSRLEGVDWAKIGGVSIAFSRGIRRDK